MTAVEDWLRLHNRLVVSLSPARFRAAVGIVFNFPPLSRYRICSRGVAPHVGPDKRRQNNLKITPPNRRLGFGLHEATIAGDRSLLPNHFQPWAGLLKNDWPGDAGPVPDQSAVAIQLCRAVS